jgi:hypothetical protein
MPAPFQGSALIGALLSLAVSRYVLPQSKEEGLRPQCMLVVVAGSASPVEATVPLHRASHRSSRHHDNAISPSVHSRDHFTTTTSHHEIGTCADRAPADCQQQHFTQWLVALQLLANLRLPLCCFLHRRSRVKSGSLAQRTPSARLMQGRCSGRCGLDQHLAWSEGKHLTSHCRCCFCTRSSRAYGMQLCGKTRQPSQRGPGMP